MQEALNNLKAVLQEQHNIRLRQPALFRLFRDTLAVNTGLRSAFMLDYCTSLSAQQLATAVVTIITQNFKQGAYDDYPTASYPPSIHTVSCTLMVVTINGCQLLVNQLSLKNSLNPASTDVAFIKFVGDTTNNNTGITSTRSSPHNDKPNLVGSLEPWWMDPQETASIMQQIQTVIDSCLQQVDAHRRSAIVSTLPIIDLDTILQQQQPPLSLCMPTLVGYLLGYPVVYVVDNQEHAQAASRCLSTTTLRVCTVSAKLTTLSPPQQQHQQQEEEKEERLLGFSVPEMLTNTTPIWQEKWGAWKSRLQQQWEASNIRLEHYTHTSLQWKELKFETQTCMRPVAL